MLIIWYPSVWISVLSSYLTGPQLHDSAEIRKSKQKRSIQQNQAKLNFLPILAQDWTYFFTQFDEKRVCLLCNWYITYLLSTTSSKQAGLALGGKKRKTEKLVNWSMSAQQHQSGNCSTSSCLWSIIIEPPWQTSATI